MANQIPLAEGTTAAGGVLVRPEYGDVIQQTILRLNPTLGLCDVQRINTSKMTWPVYLGRPTAGFVGEGADKPITGAEFTEFSLNIKKIATNVVYTEELLEDAVSDPQLLVNPDVESAFADLIDKHIIGTHPGAANTQAFFDTTFDGVNTGANQLALANTTQSVELGTGQDAFAVALSSALATLEGNGVPPNAIRGLFAVDARAHLRDARDGQGRPLYSEGFQREGNLPYINQAAFSSNLDGFPAGVQGGAGSPGKIVGIVGNFDYVKVRIRKDVRLRTTTEATVGTHNAWEENKVIAQWENRLGVTIYDRDRMFVKIINAA